ncbi:asparagine synthase (glutamine-hydrolyzing) [Bifidobacterium aquikefiri]|uniref:asparagine synthase (glutamine-hydrolyzing) n=1 Tax=Bifidobacterium aquikefiri TaxID=1653207 RepID=UPI0023F1CA1C|nr:asparagine synthase (glutamine-hydrolyzing) [Bifidobacterium aquikefiri]
MCGIAGFIQDLDSDSQRKIVTDMTDVIAHRGPDSAGVFTDGHTALGFRRLGIIDLDGGNQPIFNEDDSLAITFNGEMYNYRPLRDQLIGLGHTFTTHSDTEVVLHGYEQWGAEVLHRIRGMFAFVIWDTKAHALFGARDPFGIKPFYYAHGNGVFMYASEIKSMLQHPQFVKELNPQALRPYLTFQYPAIEETFFKGVFKLKEGHYFTYVDGNMEISRYYDSEFIETQQTLEQTVEEIDSAVLDSVQAQKIADVEVGSFLSSGVDSSYVAAVTRPEHTYSIGFSGGRFDESVQARELAQSLKLNNVSESIDGDKAFRYFPQILWHLDEPDSNPSCVPLFFLSELASRDLRVVLSGEGADELFAGYIDYGVHTKTKFIMRTTRLLQRLPKKLRHRIADMVRGRSFPGSKHMYANLAPAERCFIGQAKIFDEAEAESLLQADFRDAPSVQEIVDQSYEQVRGSGISELKKKQYLDIHQWMPGDILLKADKMTMAHSLELRVPFLDKELMKVAGRVPTRYLIANEHTKFAFRQAAARHLPHVSSHRKKLGFPVPIRDWLRDKKFYAIVRSTFEQPYVSQFFDQTALLKLLDENYKGHIDGRRKIWTIFTFLTWYDVFFIHDGKKPELVSTDNTKNTK